MIPTEIAHPTSSMLREVPITSIRPNQYQPRTQFDEESLSTLVDSIRAIGVLQPVLLRESAAGEYELIAGERRWRASKRAGLQTIPALVQVADDVSSLEQALVENLHREDLNALDEAAAYQQLIEDFHLTHEDVARRVGKSRVAITNMLRLFQLPPMVQRLVRDGRLTPGHARALLTTPDRALQERLAGEAVAAGLSVRALEEAVRAYAHDEAAADLARSISSPGSLGAESSGGDVQDPGQAADGSEQGPHDTAAGARAGEDGSRASGHLEASKQRPLAVRGARPPGVLELEELLAAFLNTRVSVDMGARRGRIVVEFATVEDLERIFRTMVGEDSR
ncbi:MAG: ParB/RepB/Spo0J family partition protein [Acidimicrobiales bacterium]